MNEVSNILILNLLLKPNAKVNLNKTGLFESNFFYSSGNQFDHPPTLILQEELI